jgi:8-oxo-dGTP diphosphatase
LQTVYETVLHKEFDKRNFRKKILSLDIVKDTGRVQEGVKNRPAALYEFTSKKVLELPLIG